jgi:hypothetical protein
MTNNTNKDENLSIAAEKTSEALKTWEAPQLKVLPVPSKTQGGSFSNAAQADDAWYAGPNPAS